LSQERILLETLALRAGEAAVEEEVVAVATLQLFSLFWICGTQVILPLLNRFPLSVAESESRCTAVFSAGTADSERR
jgi:hypothetical protein